MAAISSAILLMYALLVKEAKSFKGYRLGAVIPRMVPAQVNIHAGNSPILKVIKVAIELLGALREKM